MRRGGVGRGWVRRGGEGWGWEGRGWGGWGGVRRGGGGRGGLNLDLHDPLLIGLEVDRVVVLHLHTVGERLEEDGGLPDLRRLVRVPERIVLRLERSNLDFARGELFVLFAHQIHPIDEPVRE